MIAACSANKQNVKTGQAVEQESIGTVKRTESAQQMAGTGGATQQKQQGPASEKLIKKKVATKSPAQKKTADEKKQQTGVAKKNHGAGAQAMGPGRDSATPQPSITTGSTLPAASAAGRETMVASLPPVPYLETSKIFIYSIGVRSFSDQQAAESEVRKFMAQGYEAFVMPVNGLKGKNYNVTIGKFSTEEEAFTTALTIARKEKINLSIWHIKEGYHFRVREVSFN
jgi:cell division septation protein DedD